MPPREAARHEHPSEPYRWGAVGPSGDCGQRQRRELEVTINGTYLGYVASAFFLGGGYRPE